MISDRPTLVVNDPGSRLPSSENRALEGPAGTLWVADRGVPIHPQSWERFVAQLDPSRAAYFVPEIPIASGLGLPPYEPLLYWMPSSRKRFRARFFQRRAPAVSQREIEQMPDANRIVETTPEEQIHYFADHFSAIHPAPLQVSVVVCNVCNLTCTMCPYHSPTIKPTHTTEFFKQKSWMDWSIMERIAEECGPLALPIKMGNIEEPLLHPKIIDFVRLCRERGCPSVHITTNGLPLTESVGKKLLDAGLTSLYISIDAATQETYSRVRGSQLDRVEQNAHNFLRHRAERAEPCTVMMSFVRNDAVSHDEENAFRKRWIDNSDGVIFYNLAMYQNGNAHFEAQNKIAPSQSAPADTRWPCLNPWQEIYLLPDGRTYYCCETVSKLAFAKLESMGPYPQTELTRIWAGETFTALRRDLIRNELQGWPACDTCGIWSAHVTETKTTGHETVTRNLCTEIFSRTNPK